MMVVVVRRDAHADDVHKILAEGGLGRCGVTAAPRKVELPDFLSRLLEDSV